MVPEGCRRAPAYPVSGVSGPDPIVRRRHLAASAAIFGVATGLSRALGLVREIVARRYFGVQGEINAFTVAFQVPNLVRALVADAALSAAFVPVFSELLEKGEKARAWRVASTVFWLLLLGLTGLTALCMLLAPLIMAPFGVAACVRRPRRHPLPDPVPDRHPARRLGRDRRDPQQLRAVLDPRADAGLLEPRDHHRARRSACRRRDSESGEALRVRGVDPRRHDHPGAVAACRGCCGLDGRLHRLIDWRDPAVKQVFVLMIPVTLGLGLINFNAVIGTFFASRYIDPRLSPSAIDAAFRIYMLPQGMFSVAVATVLFPAISRLAARGDMDGFRNTVAIGIRQIAFLLVPAERGRRGARRADRAAALPARRVHARPDAGRRCRAGGVLVGLAFNGMMLMLNRAFFALQSPWIPTWVAAFNLTLNTLLYIPLYRVGTWGIPLAISLSNVAAALAAALAAAPPARPAGAEGDGARRRARSRWHRWCWPE